MRSGKRPSTPWGLALFFAGALGCGTGNGDRDAESERDAGDGGSTCDPLTCIDLDDMRVARVSQTLDVTAPSSVAFEVVGEHLGNLIGSSLDSLQGHIRRNDGDRALLEFTSANAPIEPGGKTLFLSSAGLGCICNHQVDVDVVAAAPIATGLEHSCAIREDGRAFCWGDGTYGWSLGHPEITSSVTPVEVQGLGDVLAISAKGTFGTSHGCAIRRGGRALCWGSGSTGQLGDGSTSNFSSPTEVAWLNDAIAIASGTHYACALRRDGQAVCWGEGDSGRLGNGDTYRSAIPVEVAGLHDTVAISTGPWHACAIRRNGQAVCWGSNNENGRLGNRSTQDSSTPVNVIGLSQANAIAVGEQHTCAIRRGGQAVCWGSNAGSTGRLGHGSTDDSMSPVEVVGLHDAIALSASQNHTCALRRGGQVVCWGFGFHGELGDGGPLEETVFSSVPVQVLGLDDAIALSAGGGSHPGGIFGHTCAVRRGGQRVCWGRGLSGQLGNGELANSSMPVEVTGLDDD